MAGELTARGQRTRAALLAAGRAEFEQAGFSDARVGMIAARAGVSHGTFYTYFPSKEDLFREVVGAVVGEIFWATGGSGETGEGSGEPYARIEEANRRYLAAVRRNARILRVFSTVADGREDFRRLRRETHALFVDRAADGLRRLQEQGLADPDLPPRTAARALGSMVEQFAHVWLDGEDPDTQEADEREAVAVLTRLWAAAIGLRRP